ncbi:MAG: DUF4124 domain-containing protein [Gammaproteobacteria bacterium]|nr:DUF4124 domain-containing protein [Gammaproteobacteria bacterium]
MLRVTLLSALLAVAATPASGQKIYKTTDQNGTTIYPESLPPGASGKELKPRIQPVTPAEAQAKLEALTTRPNKAGATRSDNDAVQQEMERLAARDKENCAAARKNLEVLSNSGRVQATYNHGQIDYLDEEARRARTERTRRQIQGASNNSNFFVSARKYRAQNRSV